MFVPFVHQAICSSSRVKTADVDALHTLDDDGTIENHDSFG